MSQLEVDWRPVSVAARRRHPVPEARDEDLRSHPEPEARAGSWEEPPTPEARAGGWEEQPQEWWLLRHRRA